jgi:osmotically-inducible protein OsmY
MEETEPDAERLPERVERGDLEIQDHVCTMLRNNSETGDLTDIEVLVSRGIVLLRGSVPSEQDISIVDDIVSDLDGVREVRNELRVAE